VALDRQGETLRDLANPQQAAQSNATEIAKAVLKGLHESVGATLGAFRKNRINIMFYFQHVAAFIR